MTDKQAFLRNDFMKHINSLEPSTPRAWGKMNVHQMIEHMSDSFRQANGKDIHECITPAEHIARMQAFIMSDKPFKENTPNSLMSDEPKPVRYSRGSDSLAELQMEIDDFFKAFAQNEARIITNPFFGDLNFELWVNLLYKHSLHHLRQFGITVQ